MNTASLVVKYLRAISRITADETHTFYYPARALMWELADSKNLIEPHPDGSA